MTARVLVVGPVADREALAELIVLHGHEAHTASGSELVDAVRDWRPDVVLVDVRYPDLEGRAVLDAIAGTGVRPRTILVSPHLPRSLGVECVQKPLDPDHLFEVLPSLRRAA